MRKYDKEFKEEAVKLTDEVGIKQAAAQLGVVYYTLSEWRQKRKAYGDHTFVADEIYRLREEKQKAQLDNVGRDELKKTHHRYGRLSAETAHCHYGIRRAACPPAD